MDAHARWGNWGTATSRINGAGKYMLSFRMKNRKELGLTG